MSDQPNFESEAAIAFEKDFDNRRINLDGRLKRKLQQITYHEGELKKLEDQAAAREKTSKPLERKITYTRNAIKLVRKEYSDAIVEFHSWTKDKLDEVGKQVEAKVEQRLEDMDVQLKSLKYDDAIVEADK